MTAGREVTPSDAAATRRLKEYWAHGKGALKIGWGTPHDYDRCIVELGKYVHGDMLHGLCANLHKEALGEIPGDHNHNGKLDRFEGR